MRGGYQNFRLSKALDGDGEVTIPGIYEAFEGSLKAILLENITIDTTEYKPTFIAPVVSGTSFVFIMYGYTVTVADDDGVTCAEIEEE